MGHPYFWGRGTPYHFLDDQMVPTAVPRERSDFCLKTSMELACPLGVTKNVLSVDVSYVFGFYDAHFDGG
jgi:hypothetical protein